MLLNCCLVYEPMVVRDIGRLHLPQVGRVAPYDGDVPFLVRDAHDQPVVSVLDYLRMCQACGFEPLSIEAYARALLRWFRFLLCTKQEDTPGWSVQMLKEPDVSPSHPRYVRASRRSHNVL
ncbi:hypothetical protein [Streptomyces sp. NBC_01443]|uniref:hypothetical protein n=1 Tax=Streptomyces sp. NBC_01443 TaxID=2903868 RepID=UPI00225257F0|nr:hypothetical protein [Streptomyces sp. NBC_01443]MCX4632795.1 hypothetical protein [Streptomyces sp. NBC_01443]